MADDKGGASCEGHRDGHILRPGKSGSKRKTRRRRGAAKLRSRASIKDAAARAASGELAAAGGRHVPPESGSGAEAGASHPIPEGLDMVRIRTRSGKRPGTSRSGGALRGPGKRPGMQGAVPRRRKPRVITGGPAVCMRGITARVRVPGGLPVVLRCAGRRELRSGTGIRGARPAGRLLSGTMVPPHLLPTGARMRHAADQAGSRMPRAVPRQVAQAGSTACATSPPSPPPMAAAQSSWALPLPKRDEPLVEAHAGRGQEAQLAPLARDRAPALWHDSLIAHIGAWLRGTTERLGRLAGASTRLSRPAPRRARPSIPAIARANREISTLRAENERLRLQIEALERLRKAVKPDGSATTPRGGSGYIKA